MTTRSFSGSTGTRPGIPIIEIKETIAMFIAIEMARALLGLDSQKCLLSLTDKTVK
jgi:hypothetical protein